MRRKKAGTNFDSFIGKNTAFKGDIVCSGSVRVDGSVTGDIKAEGDVLLGREGFIKGRIDAVNVHLSGTVEGNVRLQASSGYYLPPGFWRYRSK